MVLADISFGEVFLSVLWFCGLFLWIAIAISVFSDLFGDHELSGWAKAGWTVVIFVLPLLGVLVYLIARGESMRKRAQARAEKSEQAFGEYVRDVAGGGTAAELEKLADLHSRGVIDDEELARAKAKTLGG